MKGGNGVRFGMFAAAHFLWSLLCCWPMLQLLDGKEVSALIGVSVMMFGYFPLGWVVARCFRWPAPTRKQSIIAVLAPTAVAWFWAGMAALGLYLDHVEIAVAFGMPAFFLASPSLLFVLAFMPWVARIFGATGAQAGVFPLLGWGIFFAGLLPPLLFFAGSWLYSISKKTPETE